MEFEFRCYKEKILLRGPILCRKAKLLAEIIASFHTIRVARTKKSQLKFKIEIQEYYEFV